MSIVTDKLRVAIIGSGFAGLSAAAYLAKSGFQVEVFEKNEEVGGRARQLATQGYVFDMGPSWYWMPDVFEKFFKDFGYEVSDLYQLTRLDPAFTIIFPKNKVYPIPDDYAELCELFEVIEPGSSEQLAAFMKEARFKYEVGIEKLVYKPGLSLLEFADLDLIRGIFKLQVFTSFSKHVKKYFKNPQLIALMEFPVLFLGATPEETPALYSLMNYAGLKLGTWYPAGGFGEVIKSMRLICDDLGVQFNLGESVFTIHIENNQAKAITTSKRHSSYHAIVAAGDYHHMEQQLLQEPYRNYKDTYWKNRVMAPSCLIFYLGVNTSVKRLQHHNLFFDEDLKVHASEIYTNPKWPTKPLFYVCCPSKTDHSVAPAGHENLFVLIPIAPDLKDEECKREEYFTMVMHRLETYCNQDIRKNIDYKKSYCVKDFIADYHSFKGNAYGLANTLSQTANLKPSIRNKKVSNLFYAGQLTVPGPGVPPSLISGQVAANQVIKHFKSTV